MWDMLDQDRGTRHWMPSGKQVLFDTLLRIDARTPRDATPEEPQRTFHELLQCGWINGTAVPFMRDAGAVAGQDQLAQKAFDLIGKLAELVEFLPDPSPPPAPGS